MDTKIEICGMIVDINKSTVTCEIKNESICIALPRKMFPNTISYGEEIKIITDKNDNKNAVVQCLPRREHFNKKIKE